MFVRRSNLYQGVPYPYSTLWNRAERNEAVHGRSFRSYVINRVRVHPESWASPAKMSTNDNFVRMPRHNYSYSACVCATSVHLHLQRCQSPSNKAFFVPVQSGRSVGLFGAPEEEKWGPTDALPLPRKLFFSGCMESVRCRQPISVNAAGK